MYLSYCKEANITPKAFASVVNKQTQTTYGTKVAIPQMQKFTIIKLKSCLCFMSKSCLRLCGSSCSCFMGVVSSVLTCKETFHLPCGWDMALGAYTNMLDTCALSIIASQQRLPCQSLVTPCYYTCTTRGIPCMYALHSSLQLRTLITPVRSVCTMCQTHSYLSVQTKAFAGILACLLTTSVQHLLGF